MAQPLLLLTSQLDSVQNAVSSSRIKYTAIAASSTYLVCGANTGSLYIFQRQTNEMQRLVSLNELSDPVHLLSVHPHIEDIIAIVSGPTIYLMKLNLEERNENEKILLKITEHKSPVTSIIWSNECSGTIKIFSADVDGHVCLTDARKLVQKTVHLYKCDTPVFQLDIKNEKQLIISSTTQVFLIDFEKEKATKVGSKARNGNYGACFHPTSDQLLLAARPGKNMWVASTENSQVQTTMKLKDSLQLMPNTAILSNYLQAGIPVQKWAPIQLRKLERFGNKVISWDGSCMILLDPQTGSIVSWHHDVALKSLAVTNDALFLLHVSEGDMTEVYRVDSYSSIQYAVALFERLKKDTQHELDQGKDVPESWRPLWLKCAYYTSAAPLEDLVLLQELLHYLSFFKNYKEEEQNIINEIETLLAAQQAKILEEEEAQRLQEDEKKKVLKKQEDEEKKRKEDEERRREEEEEEKKQKEVELEKKRMLAEKLKEEEERERVRKKKEEEERKEAERKRRKEEDEERRKVKEREELEQIEEAERKRKALLFSSPQIEVATAPEKEIAAAPVPYQPEPQSTTLPDDFPEALGEFSEPIINIEPVKTVKTGKIKKKRSKKKKSSRVVDIAPPRLPSLQKVSRSPVHTPEHVEEPEIEENMDPKEKESDSPQISATSTPSREETGSSMFSLGAIRKLTEKALQFAEPEEITKEALPAPEEPKMKEVEEKIVSSVVDIEFSGEDETTAKIFQKITEVISVPDFIAISSISSDLKLSEAPNGVSLPLHVQMALNEWICSFDVVNPPKASLRSLRVLVTICYEHNINENVGPSPWIDEQSLQFITTFIPFLILPRVLYLTNHNKLNHSQSYILDSQKSSSHKLLLDRTTNWQKLNTYFQDGDSSSALALLSSKRDLGYILAFLPQLLASADARDQIRQFLVKSFPALLPRNLHGYTISSGFGTSNKLEHFRTRIMIIEYLEALWILYPDLQSDPKLLHFWFVQCLSHKAPAIDEIYLNPQEFIPKNRAHMPDLWGHHDRIMNVLTKPTDYPYDNMEIQNLCKEKGYLPGLFYLYENSNENLAAVCLAMHSDDQLSFISFSERLTSHEWKSLLCVWNEVKRGSSARLINIELFVSLLLRSQGGYETILLLETCPSFADKMTIEVYRGIERAGKLDIQQEMILPQLRELLNSHLWKNRPAHLSPQAQYCIGKEIVTNDLDYADIEAQHLPYFYEEAQTHWGVSTRLLHGTCPICTLSFVDVEENAIIFKCGHAFHHLCNKENACTECFHMDSLLHF